METVQILCLANSKKYGERCIAGIQLRPDEAGQYRPVFTPDGHPSWLRPVSDEATGQVPAAWVQDVRVGDIVQLTLRQTCPTGYQSENVLFVRDSLRRLRRATLHAAALHHLCEAEDGVLFGNDQKALAEEEIAAVHRSLVLVWALAPQIHFGTPYHTKPRLAFTLGHTRYNLPMTDVNFYDTLQENPAALEGLPGVFLTVSLGVRFEEKYYKLAAGVLPV